jgi:hypothetical protein
MLSRRNFVEAGLSALVLSAASSVPAIAANQQSLHLEFLRRARVALEKIWRHLRQTVRSFEEPVHQFSHRVQMFSWRR